MSNDSQLQLNWVKAGIITGLLTTTIYPLLIFVSMPKLLTVLLVCFVGPLLSVASYGLYQFIKIHQKTVTLQIAMISNIIAGTIFNLILIVQLARQIGMRDYIDSASNKSAAEMLQWISKGVYAVQAGLDVSWDIYIVAGTFFFGWGMPHPRSERFLVGSALH